MTRGRALATVGVTAAAPWTFFVAAYVRYLMRGRR